MRRTIKQIEQSNEITSEYLQQCDNNPHEAYNRYIKYYLESGNSLPSCIEGIKDFIKASKPETKQAKKQYTKKIIVIDSTMKNANFNKGIEALQSRINIINEEIQTGRLKNDNMSYCCNSSVSYFNDGYSILSTMNILPETNNNLTCIEYTKERIKVIEKIPIK